MKLNKKKSLLATTAEISQKQDEVLLNFNRDAAKVGSYGIAILDDARTGATMAITNFNNVEIIAEMLAGFTAQYTHDNKIQLEDFLDIYVGHYERFMSYYENNS